MNSPKNPWKESERQGLYWAWFVFFSQIPFVFWYSQGGPAVHPIVVMLPLVGIINFYVEKRDQVSLGLHQVQPGRSLIFALVYAGLSILGMVITLKLEGVPFKLPAISAENIWELVSSFLVGVFIIALWEEVVNRGFIQTRLQAAWGFWGVIITSLLFASMHIPSALLDSENDLMKVAIRFLETGLAGFAVGFVYWRTRSVLTTITIHGLNNFAITEILPLLTGFSVQQFSFNQSGFQLVWLVGQVGMIVFCAQVFLRQVNR
jgi:membrane protease YdiL (CAAX protease family)